MKNETGNSLILKKQWQITAGYRAATGAGGQNGGLGMIETEGIGGLLLMLYYRMNRKRRGIKPTANESGLHGG
jgi:hypothetical protein